MYVRELLAQLADPLPIVAAVDVEGCSRSNGYSDAYVEEHGVVLYRDKDTMGNGYFQYRLLGTTSNGTYILETLDSGGSGAFKDLLFIRFEFDSVAEDGQYRNRILMKCIGSFTLGDRDDGKVRLDGDRVIIGKSRYREKEVIIEVNLKPTSK